MLNVLPIAGFVWAGWKWSRGELPVERLPKGAGGNAIGVGAALALLFVVARWSLPTVHRVVKRVEVGMRRRRAIMDRTTKGNPFRAALMMPLLGALWTVAYPIRFALIAASLALAALVVVGGVRFFDPDFLTSCIPAPR
ncbi:MAG TPA: hypothetical protein VEI02_10155 [Planctomycetota bacterium]|nr:hypothetical protein [Planctomycetota bacterium]